jgi:peptidoglycan LD-endopeptidase CwlK
MTAFSNSSKMKLFTCDKTLQTLFNEVIKEHDCIILCGHRGEDDQEKAFDDGKSKLHYPNSKHNSSPSKAVDAAPYHSDEPHIRWSDIDDFKNFAAKVMEIANRLNIEVKWGGNWAHFHDYPHWEI